MAVIAAPVVPATMSKEPGQAFRIMIGVIAVLAVGMLVGLGLGTGRLDDLREADAAEIEGQQAALAQREQAVSQREIEAGVRESAVSDRETAVTQREEALSIVAK